MTISTYTDKLCRDIFRKAIVYVREEFRANPLRFFSEKDIHWLLCRRLEQELVNSGVQESVDQLWSTRIQGFSTSLIHQEYGTIKREGEQFDVVLLAPEDVVRIDYHDLTVNGSYIRPIAVAEFTTEKSQSFSSRKAGVEKGDLVDKYAWDIEKLRSSGAEDAYAELLYRVVNKTKRGAEENVARYAARLLTLLEETRANTPHVNVSATFHYLYKNQWQELSL